MVLDKLDFFFPFLIFAYGVLMTFVLGTAPLVDLAESRLPAHITQQIKGHRGLALFCLVVGGLWSVQNLWL